MGWLRRFPFFVLAGTLPASIGFSLLRPTRAKDTNVVARGEHTSPVIPPPDASADDVTLTRYMRLPVEQYALIPMPMGSSLTRLTSEDASPSSGPGDAIEFELVVPKITFFKLSLQPVVHATVQPREDRVEIRSQSCTLRGSPYIEKVQLNERFDICVNTTLTWEDSLSRIGATPGDGPRDLEDGPSANCSITAETRIHVDIDVPRPFSSVPKAISQRTGNAALALSLKLVQATFVRNLAQDYAKWATEADYRNYRASLSARAAASKACLAEANVDMSPTGASTSESEAAMF